MTADNEDASSLNRKGLTLSRTQRKHERALELLKRAAELEPDDFSSWFNIGATCRFIGRLAEAEAEWNNALALCTKDGECHLLRSQLKRQTRECNHVAELRGLLEHDDLDVMARVQVHYALAKELEDIGSYDLSFECLSAGASLRRRHMQYDVNSDLQVIDRIIAVFDQDMFTAHRAASTGSEAIFIIGMPRTGSTLVERIISSHPDVSALGELPNFAKELVGLCQKHDANIPDRLSLVDTSAELDFPELGRRYLASLGRRGGSVRFTDKMPLNFLYCGLIDLALPGATIVHVTRHPADTIYAMYKQLFDAGYPMSYELIELAEYYCAYRRLMDHWNEVCRGRIITLRYEDLVTHQEEESRRIIDACGLGWDESCMRLDRNTGAITTASATQVRQGIYATSVGAWKNVRAQLKPAIDRLDKLGISC